LCIIKYYTIVFLIVDISITCTIGLEIIATDGIGLLAKISKACAKKRFLISGVEQELQGKPNKISIRLHLYLEEQGEYAIPKQILEVSGLIEDIRHIGAIDSVERFAIEGILE
jgi:ACT domain-containing protein